ncbi:MAG: flagellar M-ring protein FliF [Pseudomonadota bacterium]|nr:flagellar M-ring protein FliF [Pseudomonadota bacterium]MDE3036878.1 flagellar M-ring protein FliF [Pseudomonadota bacterium]
MSALGDTLRSMGRTRVSIVLLTAAMLFSFLMVVALHTSTGTMAPLYTGLSIEDSAKIAAELEKSGTPYELASNGSAIMVPSDRVLRLRMSMAEEGLPSGGSIVGYEIFDHSETLGSSNFVMNVNLLRALEGELSRTIDALSDVDSARVHLVMPQHELFSRERDKPSASVVVKMRGGMTLERGEVLAITHLVASSVPGLQPGRVTVVDSHGRLLARGEGEGVDAAADGADEYRLNYQNRLRQNLEDMLEKVVGDGKVRVEVTADVDFNRTVTNSEKYDPNGQVARSTQSTSETDKSQDKSGGGGGVSVANNLPQASAAAAGGGDNSTHQVDRSNDTTNYEISKTVQNQVTESGVVKKLSVAVLVDGTYTTDAGGKQTYAPRTADELKQIKSLVSSAIGYDEKRGDNIDVVNMRFTQESLDVGSESFFDRIKYEMQSIIQTLIVAVVAILAILLVLRPAVSQLIKTVQAPSDRVAGELAALETPGTAGRLPAGPGGGAPGGAPETMIDVANIAGSMKSSSIKQVNEIVEKYPEETMGVLRQWVVK